MHIQITRSVSAICKAWNTVTRENLISQEEVLTMKPHSFKILIPSLMAIAVILSGCESGNTEVYGPVSPSAQISRTSAAEPCIQVGETVIYLGKSTVDDLVEAGAVFLADHTTASIDYSEDPLNVRKLSFQVGPTTLTVQARNMKNDFAKIKSSVIISAYFDGQQVCGIGGIMIGDSMDTVKEKIGEPYLIINSEDYKYASGGASMTANGRVYGYVSQLDDMTARICIDRNSYAVTVIEESAPVSLITEPKQVSDDQIRTLIKTQKKKYSGTRREETLMDAKNAAASSSLHGQLSSVSYNRIRVLTLDRIRDPKAFYQAGSTYYTGSTASSYLVIEYQATITLNGGTKEQTRQNCWGCFYIPNAYISEDGSIQSLRTSSGILECKGVYSTEEAMLESLFADNELGYQYSNYTSMDRAI